jgi:hypothetical protein
MDASEASFMADPLAAPPRQARSRATLERFVVAARRLMDPDYSSKWEAVEEALATLGHHLVIEAA